MSVEDKESKKRIAEAVWDMLIGHHMRRYGADKNVALQIKIWVLIQHHLYAVTMSSLLKFTSLLIRIKSF